VTIQTVADGFKSYREWATDTRPRIGTGHSWFDLPTGGGIARSELGMFIAFSGVGKTTWALSVIKANPDVPILFFSMEMSWRMVVARLAAMELGVSTKQLEADMAAGNEPAGFQAITDKYRGLVCDDTSDISLKEATTSFEAATDILGTKPRLVIWDYLELISGGGLMSKSEQVDKAAVKLRSWTRNHDTSSLVLHQISQESGGYKPLTLSSGRYGGYQPCDFVLGAYREELNPDLTVEEFQRCRNSIHFQLLKNRNGQTEPRGVKYRLDPVTMTFTPWGQPYIATQPKYTYQSDLLGLPDEEDDSF
jgi:replicative DNA helicase